MANYRVNAGFLPLTHWLHDPLQGGGRIIGEACHFVDLLTFLIGRLPVSVLCRSLPDGGIYRQDNVLITLVYPDGSIANITYLANGDKSVSKETCEIFTEGSVIKLDDFRVLELTRNGKTERIKSGNQDKGHQAAWKSFISSIRKGGNPPIPYEEIWGVHRVVFAAVESLRSGKQVNF